MIGDSVLDLLVTKISSPAWTPGKKDIAEIVAVWGRLSLEQRELILSKFTRLDAPAAKAALNALGGLDTRMRSELTRPILKAGLKNFGRHPETAERLNIQTICQASLQHPEARIRKSAAQAIGTSWAALDHELRVEVLAAMKQAASVAQDPSEIKAITDALGKSGDASALAFLSGDDFEKDTKTRARSIVKLTRDLAKASDDDAVACPDLFAVKLPIITWFTPGLEQLAQSTDVFKDGQRLAPGLLKCPDLKWADLKKSFLWHTAGFQLDELNELTPDALVKLLKAYSEAIIKAMPQLKGKFVRIRLGRSHGVSRSFLWEFAEELMKANCGLINDGRDPHWELELFDKMLVLVPKKHLDERFAWRSNHVDGSSDPTVAAAIVTMADITANETVFDPFCGAGTELILANKMKGAHKLIGSDLDPLALDAARESLKQANVSANLFQGDGSKFAGSGIDVVISNPPFGMRTARGGAREVLETFFANMAPKISRGGRVVILSHAPSSTRRWAHDAGLDLRRYLPVSLGRMECELQCFVRR
jgi:predicted RNA methylase